MKIRTIHLGENGMPEALDVRMTASEAAFLARHLGKLNHTQNERYEVINAYDELDDLFNRFWENGVDDYPTPNPTKES